MNLVKFFAVAGRLASLSRFSMERLISRESVLEHTGFVVLLSWAIATEVNAREQVIMRARIVPLDMGKVLQHATAHDMEEIITGDIARPTKYSSVEALTLFKSLSASAIRTVAESLDDMPAFGEKVIEHNTAAKQGREGAVVAIADMLAVVYKVWDEVIVHDNKTLVRQAIVVKDQIRGYRSRVEELFADLPRAKGFLFDVLKQAEEIALEAEKHERPILGTLVENVIHG